MFIDPPVGVA